MRIPSRSIKPICPEVASILEPMENGPSPVEREVESARRLRIIVSQIDNCVAATKDDPKAYSQLGQTSDIRRKTLLAIARNLVELDRQAAVCKDMQQAQILSERVNHELSLAQSMQTDVMAVTVPSRVAKVGHLL